ncbi:MarR family winged helix-turn-helix transcriptional regulator [Anaeromassilibacillus sp. 1001302B_160321_C8]|uniref:MarR family winged helix-turn-helix transcriptional regulator n=1 Tax=Anaeromassilibacillus sp. 1001302B_160321_C8 TaxID=2787132 RepID=UPI001FAE318F|nr:MarR family transcriptional regulator [Anaeromassilibacillus sp. 1001302B_160321_C8]
MGTGQPKLLVHLERQGPCSQRELAEYFEIDPAAVSRMLCALEKSGFVTRKAHPESRRKDLVELTEQGHTMAKIWRGNYQKMEEIMLKGFSDQERAQFADYLIRAYHNFREREEEPLCKI